MNAEETIVVESQVAEDTVTENELDTFVYEEYRHLFPEVVKDALEDMLRSKEFGWKSKARMLINIAKLNRRLSNRVNELIESFSDNRTLSQEDRTRNAFRKYLNSLGDTEFNAYVNKFGVTVTSLKGEAVEAIVNIVIA
jgi:hypothetical protein